MKSYKPSYLTITQASRVLSTVFLHEQIYSQVKSKQIRFRVGKYYLYPAFICASMRNLVIQQKRRKGKKGISNNTKCDINSRK